MKIFKVGSSPYIMPKGNLADFKTGDLLTVTGFNTNSKMKSRLNSIGINDGTLLEVLHKQKTNMTIQINNQNSLFCLQNSITKTINCEYKGFKPPYTIKNVLKNFLNHLKGLF
jgi:Fe2+ transport system protein FeoA